MKKFLLTALSCLVLACAAAAQVPEPDQITTGIQEGSTPKSASISPNVHQNGQAHSRHGIPSIDSLVNYNTHFFADGYGSAGNFQREWFLNTVGNPPNNHGTTNINAPVVPVSIQLLNFDGTPRFVGGKLMYSDVTPFIQPTVESPVYGNAMYSSSSTPTQFTDAVMRAQNYGKAKDDWHTILVPSVKTPRVMKLLRGTYQFALNPDGTCCRFILVNINAFANGLFPAVASDTTTPIGAAENAGEVTTKDMSTFLFPNVFLFFNNGSCCVVGFHSYDVEPGDDSNGNVEKRYVVNYSSWVTPGLSKALSLHSRSASLALRSG